MSAEFSYVSPGLEPELNSLAASELQHHYCAHLNAFLLDEYLGSAYLNKFLAIENLQSHSELAKCFVHLLGKMSQLLPFHSGIKKMHGQVFNTKLDLVKFNILGKYFVDDVFLKRLNYLQKRGKSEEAYESLLSKLRKDNTNVLLGEMLLELSLASGRGLLQWIEDFRPHEVFEKDWNIHAIYQAAKHGQTELAIDLWERARIDYSQCGENLLCHIGACFAKCGDTQKARKCFLQAIEMDPTLLPIKLLINEFDSPFVVDYASIHDESVPILIYSYNKADLLATTLKSVCDSDIGCSSVVVLLNGCTDGSLEVVEKIKKDYSQRHIEIINMPINMGAPAARNYLLHYVHEHYSFNYVVYLDDDVILPVNWLKCLLSAMREDKTIGVVGCRIVNPDDSTAQYLFRDLSIVKPGNFRLTLPKPIAGDSSGIYAVRRDVCSVMGCCHMIRKECFQSVPEFDIQFSPSQLDDVAFHLDVNLQGWKVRYLGSLACVHYRATGFQKSDSKTSGNSMGNDVKFYYRFRDHFPEFTRWMHSNTATFMRELP